MKVSTENCNGLTLETKNQPTFGKILGIDPGLATIGFGLLTRAVSESPSKRTLLGCQWGVISTSKDKTDANRLAEIYRDLHALCDQLNPDCVSIERLFFFKNAKTMVPVCQARGVILLVLAERKIQFEEYTPMQVKQAIAGSGKADKKEVQEMARQLLALEKLPRPDDAADALALAVCHLHHMGERIHLDTMTS